MVISKTKKRILVLASVLFASLTQAKVINVHPGAATLNAAVAGSESGDVLILQPGSYSSDGIHVDKSLTIRAATKDAMPMVVVSGLFFIGTNDTCPQEPNISVTLQGLNIVSTNAIATVPYITSDCSVAEVNIFENRFSNFNIAASSNGVVRVIGNTISNGMIKVSSKQSYIAANTITGGIFLDNTTESYMVGNSVDCRTSIGGSYSGSGSGSGSGSDSSRFYLKNYHCQAILINNVTTSYILANDITLQISPNDFDNSSSTVNEKIGIIAYKGQHLISSNVVRLMRYDSLDLPLSDTIYTLSAFKLSAGVMDVFNNIVDFADNLPTTDEAAIYADENVEGHIQNNIIVNHPNTAIVAPALMQVTNNLCYNNNTDCGNENGNISADPMFVNFYQLDNNSPAIDAGYDVMARADLDKSRADMGIYGGPFGYEQYAAQRDTTDAPFLFPLFNDIGATDGDTVAVKVLAVSRIK